jgi:hypothetical protein
MQPLSFNSLRNERGSAPIEIIGFGVMLMVPAMWFSINLLAAQNDQFAAAAIAEHGLRAWVQTDVPNSKNFQLAVQQIAQDFHEPQNQIKWMVSCADPQPCAANGQLIRLEVSVKQAHAEAVMRWGK